MRVFFDTWGWLELRDKRGARHAEVLAFFRSLDPNRDVIVTTDYVLDETFTALFKRLPFSLARESLGLIDRSVSDGYLILERITPARFEVAKVMRLKYDDKPAISFTDLTSMAVMLELGLTQILTGDAHFTHVGLSFQLVS